MALQADDESWLIVLLMPRLKHFVHNADCTVQPSLLPQLLRMDRQGSQQHRRGFQQHRRGRGEGERSWCTEMDAAGTVAAACGLQYSMWRHEATGLQACA